MTGSISVVMPCYNGEAHLREALDSVLAQTLAADEIVVVDDASKDGSVEIVKSYGDRVKLLPSPNATGTGHGAAANRGIMASRGDYIAFLQDKQVRTEKFLNRLATEVEPITTFDIIEALDILNEDRIASDARRFYGVVLDSETQN